MDADADDDDDGDLKPFGRKEGKGEGVGGDITGVCYIER